MDAMTGAPTGGLGTRAARVATLLLWVLGVLRGALEGDLGLDHPALLIAFALSLAGALLVTTPGDRPLSRPLAARLVAVILASSALILAGRIDGDAYLLDYNAILAALLLVRGNVVWGAATGLVLIVACVVRMATASPAESVPPIVLVPLVALPMAVAVRLGMLWAFARERAHRSAAAEAQREAAASERASRVVEDEVATVRRAVVPLLEQIAEGVPLTPRSRAEIGAVEGAVRDRIRAPAFQTPAVTAAIRDLRLRGVEVTAVSDRHLAALPEDVGESIVAALPPDAARVVLRATEREDGVHVTVGGDATRQTAHTVVPMPHGDDRALVAEPQEMP